MDESTSSDTTALVDLRLYGARGDVPRSELHGLRGVFLHEALTGLIEEIPALAARHTDGDQRGPWYRRRWIHPSGPPAPGSGAYPGTSSWHTSVSYTHIRAHETD